MKIAERKDVLTPFHDRIEGAIYVRMEVIKNGQRLGLEGVCAQGFKKDLKKLVDVMWKRLQEGEKE